MFGKFSPPSKTFIEEKKLKYAQYSKIFGTRKSKPEQEQINVGYNIAQLQTAYKYNGIQNQTFTKKPLIAIVMFNSYSKLQSDFDLFCQNNNLPPYMLNIIPINNPPEDTGSGGAEQCIDTQICYGICPNADIIVVQSESASLQDLAVAISVANLYNPQVMNMSWGISNFNVDTNMSGLFTTDLFTGNCLYVAASGDDNIVQWPSTSPDVLAVGATSLYTNEDGSISSQRAWSLTGCGPSEYFAIPNYQIEYTDLQSIYRNTTDISSVGAPVTGIQIYFNGRMGVYGGTSVAAPQLSGMLAIANGIRLNNGQDVITSYSKSNLGVQNILYANYASRGSELFYDVVSGTSGEYSATTGWDIPTGLGTPYGEALVKFLVDYSSTTSPNVQPIDQSLDTIRKALPPSLAENVVASLVEEVFVWVLNDNASASKLVTVLQEKGFKNIKVDPKGNTVTAGAGTRTVVEAEAACKSLVGPLGCK